MFSKLVNRVYKDMQKNYVTFRILVFLKEMGITRRINSFFLNDKDEELRKHPSEEMRISKAFYYDNDNRIQEIKSWLADDKSWNVYQAVIDYRTLRRPIPFDLYSENDQYFPQDIIKLSSMEVFVDGGGYTGDTIQQFINISKKRKVDYSKIISFEPNRKNYSLIHKFFWNNSRIVVIPKGLSSKEEKLHFIETGVTSCFVDGENNVTTMIEVVNIDSVVECREATYIKMDIEGMEMKALRGAYHTIVTNHPKLAICLYHSDDDMIQIIEYIHKIVPQYKLYIRHHSRNYVETVLYAIYDENN